MAAIIEQIHFQATGGNNISEIRADISVPTESDLPTATGITGFKLLDGTICLVRQTGAFYILDGGKWYAADGSGEV